MADGSKIGLLSAAQIYSLFGNIIDNAIEAVSELEDKEMRVISLTVKNRSNSIETDISNYYKGELEMSDGLPITVKDDAARIRLEKYTVYSTAARRRNEYNGKRPSFRAENHVSSAKKLRNSYPPP